MPRALPLAAALLLAGCGGLDEVDLTRSGSATVPGGSAALPQGAFASFPVSIGRAALDDEGVDPDDVDSARLVALRLEVTAGTPLDRWLDEVAFHVEAPGLPRVLVAEKRGIGDLPANTTAVELDATGVDLKPYLLAETTTVTAEGAGSQPAEETTVRATLTIRVDVNVTGLFD